MKKELLSQLSKVNAELKSLEEKIMELPENGVPITDLFVEWVDTKMMKVTWKCLVPGVKIDIEFFNPDKHSPWQLSVLKFNEGVILSDNEEHFIGLGSKDTDQKDWKIRIVALEGDFKSKPFDLEKNVSRETTEQITIIDEFCRFVGIVDWRGGTRVYLKPASKDMVYAFDSEDLIHWEKSEKPEFPTNMSLIQADDKILGYTTEGNKAFLWDSFNPDKGCQNKIREIYQWNIDGTLAPSYVGGRFIQLGRVRGYADQDQGGWGNDTPDHPTVDDFPVVKKAFEGTPFDAQEWLQDRRGLSIHTSPDGKRWESRILLDPENVDLPGFRGWKNKDKDGIADFYSAVMIDSTRALVKIYWKKKSRFIDRKDYSPDIPIRRRFRFTGETTFVPAILKEGKLEIKSLDSVIPKSFHQRVVTKDQVPHATNPGVPEVGQLTPHNRVIYRDGYAHIFYFYRDDIHYEGGWEPKKQGVFVLKMKSKKFDSLFT